MKLKFKFSSDVTFHVNAEYPYVDEMRFYLELINVLTILSLHLMTMLY